MSAPVSSQSSERELIEETGYHGKNWKMIGKYFSTPAYNTCLVHCYLTHCYKKSETNFDEDEVLETKIYSVQEVRRLLKTNKINDMKMFNHDKELNNLEILFTKIENDN